MDHWKQSLTTREKVLLLVALALLLIFLGGKFLLIPFRAYMGRLQEEKGFLLAELEYLEEKIVHKRALEREWKRLKVERERLSTVLPARDQLPLVLADLESWIARYPVKLTRLHTEGFSDGEGLPGVVFRAGFRGPDSCLSALLGGLERFPHLLIVEEVAWQREEGNPSLELVFTLIFQEEETREENIGEGGNEGEGSIGGI